ncbi:hypothetical protein Naga_100621g1 [Nannochloropsis gaditana]|uniref:Uncharacterized protein n=1 Tax=Nannochloropsis gaditana TaxID=72520 RepID=W7TF99_9STRA|nr:hypothetical protein Naga_100621g1 [Nannochloropsis gaditana]
MREGPPGKSGGSATGRTGGRHSFEASWHALVALTTIAPCLNTRDLRARYSHSSKTGRGLACEQEVRARGGSTEVLSCLPASLPPFLPPSLDVSVVLPARPEDKRTGERSSRNTRSSTWEGGKEGGSEGGYRILESRGTWG